MQIIGLYFTNNLEKELTKNFKTNINQQIKSINYDIRTVYNENKSSPNKIQKEVQKVVDEYALRTEIDTIRFINDSEVILATSNDTTKENIHQKINDKQIQNSLSLGKTNDRIKLRDDPGGKVRVWVKNFPIKDNNKILGVIHIEESIESVYAQLMKINSIFIIGTGLSLLITIILGFFIARTITKPIADMRNQALEMSKGNYTNRVKVYGNDEIGELALTFNNLSKRVQEAQANTESEKRRLDSVITHMSDGVIATDRRGRVRIVNEMALKMLDMNKDDVEGRHVLDILAIEAHYSLDELQDIAGGIIIDINEKERLIVRASFSTIIQDTGFITGYIAVLHDVTEQHHVENERREFVANVSHELRTPLTSMRSYIEALEEGAWKDENLAPQFLSVTREETDRMIRLVNDLLQLSKMDNTDDNLNKELIDFNMFIHKIINRFEMSEGKNATFIRDIPKNGIFVEIDPDKMTQVFDNVITNALKYSTEGGNITFSIKEQEQQIIVSVSDNGVGIPKENIDKIFDRFFRVDKARTRKMGGTGLGLAISKEIIEAHNGRIWANSKEGYGTSVYITLPCEVLDDGEWDV